MVAIVSRLQVRSTRFSCTERRHINSTIHKAAGSLVTGHSLQNGKVSMGNCHTERPPDPILYGGRPSGGFVNSAVSLRVNDN